MAGEEVKYCLLLDLLLPGQLTVNATPKEYGAQHNQDQSDDGRLLAYQFAKVAKTLPESGQDRLA